LAVAGLDQRLTWRITPLDGQLVRGFPGRSRAAVAPGWRRALAAVCSARASALVGREEQNEYSASVSSQPGTRRPSRAWSPHPTRHAAANQSGCLVSSVRAEAAHRWPATCRGRVRDVKRCVMCRSDLLEVTLPGTGVRNSSCPARRGARLSCARRPCPEDARSTLAGAWPLPPRQCSRSCSGVASCSFRSGRSP